MLGRFFAGLDFLAECNDCWMHAQLQNGIDLAAGVTFDFQKPVDIPGIQNQRLFADCIGARTQCEAHVRIVQIIG
ncbi:hypothetical protein D3C87_1428610 [compost metagenome]